MSEKQKIYIIMEKFSVWNDRGNINMKISPHSIYLNSHAAKEMCELLDKMSRNIEYYIFEGKIEDLEKVKKDEDENG